MIRRIKINAFINAKEKTCEHCHFLFKHYKHYIPGCHDIPTQYSLYRYRCTAFDKWLVTFPVQLSSAYRCKECKESEQKQRE